MAKYDSLRQGRFSRAPETSRFPVVQSQLLDLEPSEPFGSAFPLPDEEPEGLEQLPLPALEEESTQVRLRAERPGPRVQSARPAEPADASAALERQVRSLIKRGRGHEALAHVQEIGLGRPADDGVQLLALRVAVTIGDRAAAVEHAEWLIGHYFRARRVREACDVYRRLQERAPGLLWSEHGLVALLLAADGADEAALVAEATRLLMRDHPYSAHLAGALLKTGAHQLRAGRSDLAVATFRHVLSAYPGTVQARHAYEELAHLSQRGVSSR